MSFPAYPEYKNTEIPWMQRIPSSWQLLPFFSRFFERKESNKGMKSENLLSLSYGRIVRKDITTLEGLLPASFETYQVVHPGDIVFRLTDLQNDKRSLRSAIVNEKGIITSAYLAVSAKDFNPTFSNYLFRAYDLMKVFYSMGGGLRQSMKYDDMKWLPIVCPSINEQTQIARFLDHETAKIDALIREQKRLIELLQEKRQAVISHAVTKGLDPDVPMKDSGVEWLGEVPAHWRVVQVRHLLKNIEQGKSPECESRAAIGDEWGVLKTGCVNGGIYRSAEHKALPAHITPHSEYEVKEGDLLMSRASGSKDLIGAVAYIEKTPSRLLLSDKVFRLKLEQGVHPQHFTLLMGAQHVRAQIELAINGAEGLANNITKESIKSFEVALPTYEEQQDIFKYLSIQTHKFSELSEQLLAALSVLKERRAALISAAVTGKIDVRNWRPAADESAFDEEVRQVGMEATA